MTTESANRDGIPASRRFRLLSSGLWPSAQDWRGFAPRFTWSADPQPQAGDRGARGLGRSTRPYRRWGITPRPEDAWTCGRWQRRPRHVKTGSCASAD